MPSYSVPPDRIITTAEARAIFNSAESLYEKAVMAIFILAGARPIEVLALNKDDFTIEDGKLVVRVYSAKEKQRRQGSKGFQVTHRILQFKRDVSKPNIYIETIINHLDGLLNGAWFIPREVKMECGHDAAIIPVRSTNKLENGRTKTDYCKSCIKDFGRRYKNIYRLMKRCCKRAGAEPFTLYHDRHSRVTHEVIAGRNIANIMHLRGASDPRSSLKYIHAAPYEINISTDGDAQADESEKRSIEEDRKRIIETNKEKQAQADTETEIKHRMRLCVKCKHEKYIHHPTLPRCLYVGCECDGWKEPRLSRIKKEVSNPDISNPDTSQQSNFETKPEVV